MKKVPNPNHSLTGRKQTEEHIAKRTSKTRGSKRPPHSEDHKKAISLKLKGNQFAKGSIRSPEWREMISKVHKGEKNNNWKGGVTPKNELIRKSPEYKLWRKAVFERDRYTCVWCCKTGGTLNADHIKPFALYPALRFAIDNGRTLCVPCHRKTDTFGIKTAKKPVV